jgi:hypothetical protein
MFPLPESLCRDLDSAVRGAFAKSSTVNIVDIASDVQRRNWELNVAIEDLQARAMHIALQLGAGIAFDASQSNSGGLVLPDNMTTFSMAANHSD